MDLVTFSLKKNKNKNYNVLFVKVEKENLTATNEEVTKILKEFKKYVVDNPGLFVIYDVRMTRDINKKVLWENMHKITEFNDIGKSNIKAQSIIINNKMITSIIKTVTKVHPFVVKTKFVENNKDALQFIESNN